MSKLLIGAALVNMTVGVVSFQGDHTVPAALLAVADRPPIEVAMYLADAKVPAGLEIKTQDQRRLERQRQLDWSNGPRVPMDDLIRGFNGSHSDYRAVNDDGVVVIRPLVRSLPYLDMNSSIATVTVTGVTRALQIVWAGLDPSAAPREGGVAGSTPWSAEEIGLRMNLTLLGQGRRVAEVLNQIARQAPGRAWLVVTREQKDVVEAERLGLVMPNGSLYVWTADVTGR
jgi:hypothetical protein